jgi:hypothetical protein
MAADEASGVSTVRRTLGLTRAQLATAVGLVLGIGLLQFGLSERTDTFFAWTIRVPLTAAFLGGLYLGSGVGELLAARTPVWAHARIAVPSVGVFAALTTVVTALHLDAFHFGGSYPAMAQLITWVWMIVYVAFPTTSAIVLVRQARSAGVDPPRTDRLPIWFKAVMVAEGLLMLVVGAALLVAPPATRDIWPWPLTDLTAQAVGAWGVAIGFGNLHAVWEDDWIRIRVGMPALVGIAALELIALARFADTVAWARPSAWVLTGLLVALLLTGGYGTLRGWFHKKR